MISLTIFVIILLYHVMRGKHHMEIASYSSAFMSASSTSAPSLPQAERIGQSGCILDLVCWAYWYWLVVVGLTSIFIDSIRTARWWLQIFVNTRTAGAKQTLLLDRDRFLDWSPSPQQRRAWWLLFMLVSCTKVSGLCLETPLFMCSLFFQSY